MFDQIKPFENGQTVYAFPYFDSTCFDEFMYGTRNIDRLRIFPPYISHPLILFDVLLEENNLHRLRELICDLKSYNGTLSDHEIKQHMNRMRVNFSIVNEETLAKDYKYFVSNDIVDYKPYFYEFQGYCNNLKTLAFLLENTLEGRTLICKLNVGNNKVISEEGMVVTGSILFSASPIVKRRGSLTFSKDAFNNKQYSCNIDKLNELAKAYECKGNIYDTNNKNILNQIKTGIPDEVTVRNVGQANNILIKCTDNSYIQYDIGIDRSSKFLKNINNASAQNQKGKILQDLLSEPKPSIIILSHWDLDHILGVAYANESIYEDTIWIVPEITSLCKPRRKIDQISLSARRLLKFLEIKNRKKLYIISESWTQAQIYGSSNGSNGLQIWTGKRENINGYDSVLSSYCLTAANNFGLIVTLTNNGKTVLLPGDCDYKVLPDNIRNQDYDCLVVPHHCSKMSRVPFPKPCPSDKQRIAIISHGVNKYGHPNGDHEKDLKAHQYTIQTTATNNNITFSL